MLVVWSVLRRWSLTHLVSLWWHTVMSAFCLHPLKQNQVQHESLKNKPQNSEGVFSSDGVSAVYNVFHNFLEKKPKLEAFICWDVWKQLSKNQKCLKSGTWWLRWNKLLFFRCEWSCWWKRPADRNIPFSIAAACSGISLHWRQDCWLRFLLQVSSDFSKCFKINSQILSAAVTRPKKTSSNTLKQTPD